MGLSFDGGSLYCLSVRSPAIKGMWKQRKQSLLICLLLSSFETFPPCAEAEVARHIYSDRKLS